jgi:hypothetical protein
MATQTQELSYNEILAFMKKEYGKPSTKKKFIITKERVNGVIHLKIEQSYIENPKFKIVKTAVKPKKKVQINLF